MSFSFLCLVSWLVILILLAYMALVIVVLLNILIAQLSYTYSEAKKTAKLQYAIDAMFIVTRLEYSRLARWVRFGLLPLFVSIRFFLLRYVSNLFMYLLAFFNACHAGYGNRGCLKSHASEPRKIGAGGSKWSFCRPRDSLRSTLAILD